MHIKDFSEHTDYVFETKNDHICEQKKVLTTFVKKSFFFRAKKKFDGEEITKTSEKCNWEKPRNLELVGASPTEWRLITPRSVQTPPSPRV